MFLKDRQSGFPNGCKFYDPLLKKWFHKNHYQSLLINVSRARIQSGIPIQNLDMEIQQYICDNSESSIRSQYCTETLINPPKSTEKKCHTCGGRKK